jgi:hypothetical protein
MRRREFIALVAGATAWPLPARAQQPAMPVIGFLSGASLETMREYVAAFQQGLADAGFTEGRNFAIEYRWAEGHNDRLPALAADLVSREVAIIVVGASTPGALAAKAATQKIPIVFQVGTDPVKVGLVTSLAHPEAMLRRKGKLSRRGPGAKLDAGRYFATGPKGGAHGFFAQQYREKLARAHITLNIRITDGTSELWRGIGFVRLLVNSTAVVQDDGRALVRGAAFRH